MAVSCKCEGDCFIPQSVVANWKLTAASNLEPVGLVDKEGTKRMDEVAMALSDNPVRVMNIAVFDRETGQILSTGRRGAQQYSVCDVTGVGADNVHFSIGIPYAADRYMPEGTRDSDRVVAVLEKSELLKRDDLRIYPCDTGLIYRLAPPLACAQKLAMEAGCKNFDRVIYNALEKIKQMGLVDEYAEYLRDLQLQNEITWDAATLRVENLLNSLTGGDLRNGRVLFFPEASVVGSIGPDEVKKVIVPGHLLELAAETFPRYKLINSGSPRFIEATDDNGRGRSIAVHLLETYLDTIGIRDEMGEILERVLTQEPSFF